MKTQPLKGMRDLLPKEQALRDYIQGEILATYRAAGFQRISTPILEDLENLDKSDGGDNLNLIFKVLKRGEKLTAALASGTYDVMAAVMVGGMVPPIAIALCTTFFKKKFTADERKSGVVNYIMGLCFISEGAIPFAAADPLRVIPSCVVGSAVAGALSMLFGCTLPAPHGGIFVFAVVQNWPMYLVSLLIGSVVAMLLLALLKKPIKEEH